MFFVILLSGRLWRAVYKEYAYFLSARIFLILRAQSGRIRKLKYKSYPSAVFWRPDNSVSAAQGKNNTHTYQKRAYTSRLGFSIKIPSLRPSGRWADCVSSNARTKESAMMQMTIVRGQKMRAQDAPSFQGWWS